MSVLVVVIGSSIYFGFGIFEDKVVKLGNGNREYRIHKLDDLWDNN